MDSVSEDYYEKQKVVKILCVILAADDACFLRCGCAGGTGRGSCGDGRSDR